MEVVGIPKAWTPGTMVPDYHGTHLTDKWFICRGSWYEPFNFIAVFDSTCGLVLLCLVARASYCRPPPNVGYPPGTPARCITAVA